jgi:hypothetical protein
VASPSEVTACWQVIEAAGIPRPWTTAEETDRAGQVWAAVLADVPGLRLQAMTLAWLRSAESRFRQWPTPGALLHALPDPGQVDDADDAWAEVLRLVQNPGADKCPPTAAELDAYRERVRESYRRAVAAGDTGKADRALRLGQSLPREDAARTAALYAGLAACGGWRGIGHADEDDLVAHRASFRAAYRGHRQRRQLTATEEAVVALLDSPNRPRLTRS